MRTINKIAEIADIVDDSTDPASIQPTAQLLNNGQDIHFSPLTVSAYMVSLFLVFDSNVPEDRKEDFSVKTKELFDTMFADRQKYHLNVDSKSLEDKSN